jgi:hypothetical protein
MTATYCSGDAGRALEKKRSSTSTRNHGRAPGAEISRPGCLPLLGGDGGVDAALTSAGSMLSPPAIWGLEGSNPFRSSRRRTMPRASLNASFRVIARRIAVLKRASPKYVH